MAPGIDDVARAAGVSTATVSRALRGLPNVNAATRARVRAVAAELEYVASPSAASLASGRTRTIGLISPWINRWFFANVIEGAERTLRAHGFDVLLYTFDARVPSDRARVDPGVLRRRVDGILVVGLPLAREEIDALLHLGYPLVCIGWGGYGQVTVRLDDRATAIDATRHLIGLGSHPDRAHHRRARRHRSVVPAGRAVGRVARGTCRGRGGGRPGAGGVRALRRRGRPGRDP